MVSPKNTLQAVSFLDMVAAGLIMPQMPPHAASKLGFNPIQVGMVMSLYSGCQMIAAPIIGSISDVEGRKPILLLCLCISTFAYAYLGFTASFMMFFGLRAVLGVFKQTQFLMKAIAPDYEKDAKKQAILYGRLLSLSGLGMTAGPIISGHIMEAYPHNGFAIIATIVATIFVLNTGLVYLLPGSQKAEKGKQKVVLTQKILGTATNSLKQSINDICNVDWKVYWDVFLFKLMITLSMGLYFSSIALFLRTKHHVSSSNLGYIMSFQGAIATFSTYFIGHINKFYENDKNYTQRISHLFITLTLCLLGIALAPDVSMIVAILIPKAISGAVGRTITLEMITSRSKDSQRGTVMGASNSIRSLSGVVTPLIGGFIMQYLGIIYVFYLAACSTAIGVVLSYRMKSSVVKVKTK